MPKSLITKHIIEQIIKPTLDEAAKKKTAEELRSIFRESGSIDFNSKEIRNQLIELAKAFQTVFSTAGNTGIDFEDMINTSSTEELFTKLGTIAGKDFQNAWNSVIRNFGKNNLNLSSEDSMKQLEEQKQALLKKKYMANKKLDKYEYLSDLQYEIQDNNIKPFSKKEIESKGTNIDEFALNLQGEFTKAEDSLANVTQGTKEYYQLLIRIREIISNMYRLAGTLEKHPEIIGDKSILADYDYGNLYDITSDVLNNTQEDFDKYLSKYTENYEKYITQIDTELEQISVKTKEISQNSPEIVDKQKATAGLKTLNEIEEAYDRILNKEIRGKRSVNVAAEKRILSALDYKPGEKSLLQLSRGYTNSINSGDNWELQYQWLVKFVKEYEAYSKSPDVNKERLGKYTALYEQLKPMAINAENMLRNVLNMANNIPLVGMGGVNASSEDGAGTIIEGDSEQNQLAQRYNANKEKTLALLKKEQLSYEEILYLVKEIQTEYDKVFYGNKNLDLGDDASSLMTSVYDKLRRGDLLSTQLDYAINGVGMSAEEGARILTDYQDRQLALSSASDLVNKEAAEQERLAQEKANARRDELYRQLSDFNADAEDIGTLEANLEKRKEIFELLQQENLLTNEISASYDTVNKKIQEKISLLKQSKDNSYSPGSILDNPMFANMFGKAKNESEEKHNANEGSAKAAKEELGAVQETTLELEKQQKLLLYRRVEGQADLSRVSNRSIDALYNKDGKPIIQSALEMGFGGFGDGLYASTFEGAKDLIPGEGDFSFFEFDASKYNLYINRTVEQAEALQTFLLSLQKLVNGNTLLDTSTLTHIEDFSKEQLFEKAQQIFQNFNMTKEEFYAWIENAQRESAQIANLFKKGQTPSDRHNFGTRFMKKLGYDGVLNQTGDLDIDGNYQGSVIYDPDLDDIKQNARIFNDTEEFTSYINSEVQAHQDNTSAINTETQAQEKLNVVEGQNPQTQDDTAVHNANADAIEKEAQAAQSLYEALKKIRSESLSYKKENLWSVDNGLNINKIGEGYQQVTGNYADILYAGERFSLHNHYKDASTREGVAPAFSIGDLIDFGRAKELGTNLFGMIFDGVFTAIDTNGISQELFNKIIEDYKGEVSRIESEASKRYPQKDSNAADMRAYYQQIGQESQRALFKLFADNGLKDNIYTATSDQELMSLANKIVSSDNTVSITDRIKTILMSAFEMSQQTRGKLTKDSPLWSNVSSLLQQAEEQIVDPEQIITEIYDKLYNLLNKQSSEDNSQNISSNTTIDNDSLEKTNQQIAAQKQLNDEKSKEPPLIDDTPKLQDENTKLDEQNSKLKENINLKTQANGQGVGVAPEEIKNANELSEVLQRVESAYRELDALSSDPWNMKNEEEVNSIYQKRLEIIRRVGEENLKAYNPNMYEGIEYINNEYAERLNSFKETKDDNIYDQLEGDLGYYNEIISSSQELEALLTKRRELMKDIYFKETEDFLTQEETNRSIERRIALMRQLEPLVANGSITQDDLEDMLYEQGELDERRSMLSGIQQNLLGIDDIDEAQYMLDEYEKILVKTASGKKLTLGPEMSESDWKYFMNMDTEKAKDIEFVRRAIQQENAELEQQKKIINDVVAAKQGLKASQTKLGVTDGKDLFGKSTLDAVKEKQKILATYLQELTQIEAQEKKNGALTEAEVARRKELVGLIRNMELAVRYKDGSFYDTRNLDGMGSKLSEQIEQLNQVLNLRKQITLGYYNTGTYGTVADTFSGESVSNLINLGSIEGITEFDSSIVGQLAREYQFLHEQMLRCMLVGEEVPQSTLDRLKWFEAVDVSQIENMIPRVAELQQQINAIQNSGEYSDIRSAKIGQDDAYYDEKIQQIQTLIALQTEYMSIGGPWQANTIGSFSIDHSNESLQSTIEFFETLKKGARDVVRLKAELKNMFSDIDVSADRYKDMFDRLAMGTDSYDYTLSKITKSYNAIPREKLESDVSASIEALKKLDTFKWDTSTDDAYREVLKGIRDGTYTTVDQSIAKFKELAGIIETVKTGSTVGVSNRGSNIGLGTGTVDAGTEYGESSGIVIKEVGNLDKIRAKVAEVTAAVNTKSKEFYNEGQIVSQVVGKENAAFISLKGNIEAITSAVNAKNKAFYDEGQIVGQVVGRENAALISLQGNVNNVVSSLGGTLGNLKNMRLPNLNNTTSQTNITNESQALTNLRARVDEVNAAIRTKTASFIQEEMAVRQSVGNEIAALIRLRQNIDNINTAITAMSQGLNTALTNASTFNGINLNVNAVVDLTAIETTLLNILTAIPNAGSGVQNNNGNSGNGSQGGGDLAGRIAVQNATLDNFEAKLLNIGQLTPTVQNQINQLRTSLNNVTDNQGLTVWMNQFKTMRTNMNTEGIISDLNTLEQMYERLGQLRAKFTQANSSEERNSWDLLIQQMETAIQLMQQGLNIDQDWFDNKALEAYTRSMEKYNDQMIKAKTKENQKSVASTFNEEIKNAQREAGINKSKSTESRAIDTLISARQIQGITPEQTANLDAYEGKIEALRNTINSFPKDGIATEAQKNQLISQRLEVDAYTKETQELVANYEKLSGANVEEMGKNILGKDASVMDQQKQLSDMVIQYTNGKAVIKSYDAATNELKYTMKGASGEVTTYTATLRGLDNTLVTVRGQTTRTIGVIDSVVKKVKEFSYYFTGSMMIYRVIGWIRDGVTAVKEIDSALIELKKVTDETSDTYNRFLDTASAKAEKLGSTIVDVTSATAEFARIGYDMEVASNLAEAAIVYKNVGDGIESASDAAKSIISTIKGFGLEASDAMSIVDKFNEVGNNFAIDSKGVGDALMRSASALSAAGNDINESIGLITAANEVVQDPETVGTALKTLTMRLRAAKTEMEDEGLETEGMAESTAKLRAQLKALSHDKVDIMIDNDTFKNTTEIKNMSPYGETCMLCALTWITTISVKSQRWSRPRKDL